MHPRHVGRERLGVPRAPCLPDRRDAHLALFADVVEGEATRCGGGEERHRGAEPVQSRREQLSVGVAETRDDLPVPAQPTEGLGREERASTGRRRAAVDDVVGEIADDRDPGHAATSPARAAPPRRRSARNRARSSAREGRSRPSSRAVARASRLVSNGIRASGTAPAPGGPLRSSARSSPNASAVRVASPIRVVGLTAAAVEDAA